MKNKKIFLSALIVLTFILSLLMVTSEAMAAKKKKIAYFKAKTEDVDLTVLKNEKNIDSSTYTTVLSYKKKIYVNINRVSYSLKDNDDFKFDVKIGKNSINIFPSQPFSDKDYDGVDVGYGKTENVKFHNLTVTVGNKKIKEKVLRIKGKSITNTYLPLDFFKNHLGFSIRKTGYILIVGEKIYPQVDENKISLTSNGKSENVNTLSLQGEKYIYLGDLKRLVKNTKSSFGYIFNNEDNTLNILYYDREKGDENSTSISPKSEGKFKEIKLSSDYFGKLLSLHRSEKDLTKPLDNTSDDYINANALIVGDKVYFSLSFICDFMDFEQKTKGTEIVLDNTKREELWVLKSTKGAVDNFYEDGGDIVSVQTNNEKGDLTVQRYSSDFNLKSEKLIPFEGELFGGLFNGTRYNFILFGNKNLEKSYDKVTYHLVKYDKEFNRLDSLSIKGAYTSTPFSAGSWKSSVSMAESGDSLVIHTARIRFDGHQMQMTFIVSISSMTLMNPDDIGEFQRNHVSHSFDQRVKIDENNNVYLLDLGDAYPRSLVLTKMIIEDEKLPGGYSQNRTNERLLFKDKGGRKKNRFEIFKYPGELGLNFTGFNLGSMVEGSKNLLIGGNHIDYGKVTVFDYSDIDGVDLDKYDAYIYVVNKADPTQVKEVRLTNYAMDGRKVTYSPVMIAKIGDNKYIALWNENVRGAKFISVKDEVQKMRERKETLPDKIKNKYKWKERGNLCYQYVDQEGNLLSEVKKIEHRELAETEPIVVNGNLIWTYVDSYRNVEKKAEKILFTLPIE